MFGYVECVLLVGTAQEPRRRCVILTATTRNHHHLIIVVLVLVLLLLIIIIIIIKQVGKPDFPLLQYDRTLIRSVTPGPQLDIYLKHSVRL
jgi:hypothetical protein